MKNKKISPLIQVVLLVSGLTIVASTFYWLYVNSENRDDIVKATPSIMANPPTPLTTSPKPDVSIPPDFSSNIPTTLRTVSVTQWNVRFTAPLASSDIAYAIRDSGFVELWSPSLQASTGGQECNPGSLGGLARASSLDATGEPKPTAIKKIGDYHYYYMHPQSACSTTQSAQDILQANLKGLQSSLPQSLEAY